MGLKNTLIGQKLIDAKIEAETDRGAPGCFRWNISTAWVAFLTLATGSHELSLSEYPFHFTRYSSFPR